MINSKKSVLDDLNMIVIERYCRDYKHSIDYGIEVYKAFLKFMYLMDMLYQKKVKVHMLKEILEVDRMWHTFLLFTADYAEFCHQYFGRFLHHCPVSEENPPPTDEDKRVFISDLVVAINQEFGKETLTEWFVEKRFAIKASGEY